jgi:predicted short-subunit dehydrogenase-like oxidoreductase (DUF2520 family)
MSERQGLQSVGFIGAGVVGTSLAIALRRLGYPVIAASSRTKASAKALAARVDGCEAVNSPQDVADRAALVFLTTPDDAIETVAESVRWGQGQGVVHCSGVKPAEALEAAKNQGAMVGTFHPFQTFASVDQALDDLPGITFGIEAAGELLESLEFLAIGLGGKPVQIPPEARAAYHASAIIACGYMVALAEAGAGLWEAAGLSRQEGLDALVPLMQGTVNNIGKQGTVQAFTGPLVRGDIGTVRLHLVTLQQYAPHLVSLYCRLGLEALPLAAKKGRLSAEARKELKRLLQGWEGKEDIHAET